VGTDFSRYEHLKSDSNIGKEELETDCETDQPITSKEEADKVAREYFKVSEQPSQNAMIFEQIEGCCDIIEKLLKELAPQTEDVKGCLITHKSWRANNLRHLKGAFE